MSTKAGGTEITPVSSRLLQTWSAASESLSESYESGLLHAAGSGNQGVSAVHRADAQGADDLLVIPPQQSLCLAVCAACFHMREMHVRNHVQFSKQILACSTLTHGQLPNVLVWCSSASRYWHAATSQMGIAEMILYRVQAGASGFAWRVGPGRTTSSCPSSGGQPS